MWGNLAVTKLRWTRGYSPSQLDAAQKRFGLIFPPDLIDLFRERRPVDGHDWTDHDAIRRALARPLRGLLFDVENNALWWPEWGERPPTPGAREEVVQAIVARAPKLIPLISHRYIPASPNKAGNPIFSICQSDVIYYGANLADYFEREFDSHTTVPWPSDIREIPFWSEMVRRNS